MGEPVLPRFCGFGFNSSPEFLVLYPFAFSYLLFGNIQDALEFGRMRFDFQHCFVVINLLTAIRTIVKSHLWNGVSLTLIFAGNTSHRTPNLVTATGWTGLDLKFIVHIRYLIMQDSRPAAGLTASGGTGETPSHDRAISGTWVEPMG